MKDTEQQLKNINEQIHFTGQYLAYKDLYAQYRKSRNRNKFYEEHKAELSLYETALRVLKEKSNGQKLPSMKSLYAENCFIFTWSSPFMYHYFYIFSLSYNTFSEPSVRFLFFLCKKIYEKGSGTIPYFNA